ncbi:hypothetical protein PC129_g7649 [Phytophthora cactorum]|uniref:Tc1-like transposase DDE domain-containing protein n=1 Tax=Phytophthora cactorum TaxID=29920 RepID=A0A8T1D3Y4_9STRA|nr:hypothetical protein PC115_g5641 [Phytophthora cactorum]KAG3086472.1 hypothetical protein PC122_g9251 [Phytophthora cactorum]KAG3194622.1 hypothetical protein PC128_g9192 [Phytophthora cactorum]KAG3221621.1 hypothetical protein PC129_g7649 [Phytophthora cactorum]
MPSQARLAKHTVAEKQRVIDAHRAGRADWLSVATSNGFARSVAYRLVSHGRVENLSRGGARAAVTKVTPEVKEWLEAYLDDNCTYTLETMKKMLAIDMNISLSTSSMNRHLTGMLYTVKQPRVVPMTCSNEVNKTKRQAFAKSLKQHQLDGDCIVYFDETNFNLYCSRGRGRAKKGKRATVVQVPSKGPNLQVQCAVASGMGVVLYRLEHNQGNGNVFERYDGKKVVIVLDNAPAHRQTEQRVTAHDDMVILRLALYSPMCNPIEDCFSVLKAHIKDHLAMDREEIYDRSSMTDNDGVTLTITERSMCFMERAAKASMQYLTPTWVAKMELHARNWVNAEEDMKDMCYGE